MQSLVSVIAPVYNMSGLLQSHIAYLTGQTYHNIEILLVDDGSDDGSLEICRELSAQDSRIRVISQSHSGAAAARNNGIENAVGEYIYFMDIDDEADKRIIEKMLFTIIRDNADLAVCGFKSVNNNGSEINRQCYEERSFDGGYVRNNFEKFGFKGSEFNLSNNIWNKLYRSQVIKDNNISFPSLKRGEDTVFNLMYISHIKSLSLCDGIYYKYNSSSLKDNAEKYIENYMDGSIKSKNYKLKYAYGWNTSNRNVLEKICNEFALNTDFYIRMVVSSVPIKKVRWIYRLVKDASQKFNSEIPSRDFKPGFVGYKLLLANNCPALFLFHIIKKFNA